MAVMLSHDLDLGVNDVVSVARGENVSLSSRTIEMLSSRRDEAVAYIKETEQAAYGFNRGFGSNVHDKVSAHLLGSLQRNLIMSHACNVGPASSTEVVRATMLLRAKSLCMGFSCVRPQVVQALIALLNKKITPVVPLYGSVSASGDLSPLSHIALALLGLGDVLLEGSVIDAASALKKVGLAPLELEMKEGLALNNGAQYSTALGILAAAGMHEMLKAASITTAISAQVMLGADTPFRSDLHRLRPHPGSVKVAKWVDGLMKESPLREFHRDFDIDGEVQDPYNLRCAAQILGPCLTLINRAYETLLIEINSATDNPLILQAISPHWRGDSKWEGKYVDIVSGGHFHGMPIAIDIYGLIQCAGIVASLTNARCARYVDQTRNKGLGPQLKWPGGTTTTPLDSDSTSFSKETEEKRSTECGMMIPEYISAGLANWLWGQAMPSHLMSLPTDSGQEDHVSMAANVAIRAHDALARVADVLALELAYCVQAAALRRELDYIPSRALHGKKYVAIPLESRVLSKSCQAAINAAGELFEPITSDRYMAGELRSLSEFIQSGRLTQAVADAGISLQ